MQVAIHQPQYWPWPRYIHKVMSADVFVYLDTVQFGKNGLQNRNQIRTSQGPLWLTIPVKQQLGQTIRETKIADTGAAQKHWKTLAHNYSGTPGFPLWRDELDRMLHCRTGSLCEVAVATTEWMLEKLGVDNRRNRASEIPEAQGQGSVLIAEICRSLGATSYLTGSGALEYMKREDFSDINCEVWAQGWSGLDYQQAQPQVEFIPDLSTLDLLLNCPDTASQLIQSAGSWKLLWPLE